MDENRKINIYQKESQSYFFETMILILTFVLLLMLTYTPSDVVGRSMLPGIRDGDIAVVANRTIKRSDIVIARTPTIRIIKRVIAVGGDTVAFVQNGGTVDLYLNGELKDEPYIKEAMLYSKFSEYDRPAESGGWIVKANGEPYIVPTGCYFLMGDNRNESEDSRKSGAFARDKIEGVVAAVYQEGSPMYHIITLIYRESAGAEAYSL